MQVWQALLLLAAACRAQQGYDSGEADWTADCGHDFNCDGGSRCIKRFRVCDGITDCLDGADEHPSHCNLGKSTCADLRGDVMFILDGSNSIGEHVFDLQVKPFVKDVIGQFAVSPRETQVGAVQYSDKRRTEFDFNDNVDGPGAQSRVDAIKWITGYTWTGQALNYTVDSGFAAKNGARVNEEKVSKVGIVITDGFAQDDVIVPSDRARQAGIRLYAVGVTNYIREPELLNIVGGNRENYALIQDYKGLSPRLRNWLILRVCPVSCNPNGNGNECNQTRNEICLPSGYCGCPPAFQRDPVNLECGHPRCHPGVTTGQGSCPHPKICAPTNYGDHRCRCPDGTRERIDTGTCDPDGSYTTAYPPTRPTANPLHKCVIEDPHTCQPAWQNKVCLKFPDGRQECTCLPGQIEDSQGVCGAPEFPPTKAPVVIDCNKGICCLIDDPTTCDRSRNEICIRLPNGEQRCDCPPKHDRPGPSYTCKPYLPSTTTPKPTINPDHGINCFPDRPHLHCRLDLGEVCLKYPDGRTACVCAPGYVKDSSHNCVPIVHPTLPPPATINPNKNIFCLPEDPYRYCSRDRNEICAELPDGSVRCICQEGQERDSNEVCRIITIPTTTEPSINPPFTQCFPNAPEQHCRVDLGEVCLLFPDGRTRCVCQPNHEKDERGYCKLTSKPTKPSDLVRLRRDAFVFPTPRPIEHIPEIDPSRGIYCLIDFPFYHCDTGRGEFCTPFPNGTHICSCAPGFEKNSDRFCVITTPAPPVVPRTDPERGIFCLVEDPATCEIHLNEICVRFRNATQLCACPPDHERALDNYCVPTTPAPTTPSPTVDPNNGIHCRPEAPYEHCYPDRGETCLRLPSGETQCVCQPGYEHDYMRICKLIPPPTTPRPTIAPYAGVDCVLEYPWWHCDTQAGEICVRFADGTQKCSCPPGEVKTWQNICEAVTTPATTTRNTINPDVDIFCLTNSPSTCNMELGEICVRYLNGSQLCKCPPGFMRNHYQVCVEPSVDPERGILCLIDDPYQHCNGSAGEVCIRYLSGHQRCSCPPDETMSLELGYCVATQYAREEKQRPRIDGVKIHCLLDDHMPCKGELNELCIRLRDGSQTCMCPPGSHRELEHHKCEPLKTMPLFDVDPSSGIACLPHAPEEHCAVENGEVCLRHRGGQTSCVCSPGMSHSLSGVCTENNAEVVDQSKGIQCLVNDPYLHCKKYNGEICIRLPNGHTQCDCPPRTSRGFDGRCRFASLVKEESVTLDDESLNSGNSSEISLESSEISLEMNTTSSKEINPFDDGECQLDDSASCNASLGEICIADFDGTRSCQCPPGSLPREHLHEGCRRVTTPAPTTARVTPGPWCREGLWCNNALGEVCVSNLRCACHPGYGRRTNTDVCQEVTSFEFPVMIDRRGDASLTWTSVFGDHTHPRYIDISQEFNTGMTEVIQSGKFSSPFVYTEVVDIVNPSTNNGSLSRGLWINYRVDFQKGTRNNNCEIPDEILRTMRQRYSNRVGNTDLHISAWQPSNCGILCGSSLEKCRPELNEVCIRGETCGCNYGFKRAGPNSACEEVDQTKMVLYVIKEGNRLIDFTPGINVVGSPDYDRISDKFVSGVDQAYRGPGGLDHVYVATEVDGFRNPSSLNGSWVDGVVVDYTVYTKKGAVTDQEALWDSLWNTLMQQNYIMRPSDLEVWKWQYKIPGKCLNNQCHANAWAFETPTGCVCECPPNSFRDLDPTNAGHDCVNINNFNECTNRKYHDCSLNATCHDEARLYRCECNAGYIDCSSPAQGEGRCCRPGRCLSLNCGVNSRCVEETGQCVCDDGFVNTGNTPAALRCVSEQEINECALGRDNCHSLAVCIDLPVGYTCQCRPGYEDIDFDNPGRSCAAPITADCERCNRNGDCSLNSVGEEVCLCHTWYSGEFCQRDTRVILLIILAILFFLLALACLLFYCLKCRCIDTSKIYGMMPWSEKESMYSAMRIPRPQVYRTESSSASESSGWLAREEIERKVLTTDTKRTTTTNHDATADFVVHPPSDAAMAAIASSGSRQYEYSNYGTASKTIREGEEYSDAGSEGSAGEVFDKHTTVKNTYDYAPVQKMGQQGWSETVGRNTITETDQRFFEPMETGGAQHTGHETRTLEESRTVNRY